MTRKFRRLGRNGHKILLAITYPLLSKLLNKTEGNLRQMVNRKKFNPSDIIEIIDMYNNNKDKDKA